MNSETGSEVIRMALYDVNGNVIELNPPALTVPWVSSMHRGYTSATVAENTLPAYYRSFLNGAQWVECDARLTSDSKYVSCHDATITVDGVTYTIANETAETLTALVLSTDPVYGDCTIPLLEDILKLCCYTGMCANIDCKNINATTLAQLVVDCGMSGRSAYANTSTSNVSTILDVDPNAGFIFSYSSANVTSWATAISDYHVRQRSYVWQSNSSTSYEVLEEVRAEGFKYMMTSVSTTNKMGFAPDMIEFSASADCKTLNQTYLDSLNLV